MHFENNKSATSAWRDNVSRTRLRHSETGIARSFAYLGLYFQVLQFWEAGTKGNWIRSEDNTVTGCLKTLCPN